MTRSLGLLAGAAALVAAATAAQAATPDAAAREHWRQALVRATLPANGCFKSNYPDEVWTRVACAHRAQAEISAAQRQSSAPPATPSATATITPPWSCR